MTGNSRTRRKIEAIHPLTPQQQGMLLESVAAEDRTVHVEQLTCTLTGDLDVAVLRSAWEHLVRRHPMLRTSFIWKGQEVPLQAVLRDVELPWSCEDWRRRPRDEKGTALAQRLAVERELGFRLGHPPLMRLALVRLEDEVHRMVWTHHHILMDGWCRAFLMEELLRTYGALVAGDVPGLPPVGRTYGDFVSWRLRRDGSQDEAFWRRTLEGFRDPTPLGRETEGDGTAATPVAGDPVGELRRKLAVAEELTRTGQRSGFTASTFVQAAWSLLLHRYSGRRELLFGVTVAGRPDELDGLDRTVGLFMNTLPLRLSVDPGARVGDWLGEVQAAGVALRRHQQVTAGQVHSWSELPPQLPLFESLIVFENYPMRNLPNRVGRVEIRDVGATGARTRTPVVVLVEPGDSLEVTLVHDRRRLSTDIADRMLDHLALLLERLPRGMDETVESLVADIPEDEIPRVVVPSRSPTAAPVPASAAAPEGSVEHVVSQIWGRLLGVDPVDRDQPFFAAGGHSLLAVQLVSRLREALEVEIPLGLLYEAPTVAGLSARISDLLAGRDGLPLAPPLGPAPWRAAGSGGSEVRAPLSFAQSRLWFLDQMESGNPFYVNTSVVDLEGDLDVALLRRVLSEVVRRHEVLRTTFPAVEGRPVQQVAPPSPVALPLVDLRALPGRRCRLEVRRLARQEAIRPFDLTQGPLVRFTLLATGASRHRALFSSHHVVSDAWSNGVLRREVEVLYSALAEGVAPPLPALPVQYADYADWQRRWLRGDELESMLSFWRRHLGNAWPLPDLPTDRPRPEVLTYRGGRRLHRLSVSLVEEIDRLARDGGTTRFVVCLAVFYVLLHRLTGERDLVVGSAVAGRTRREVEPLIGCFVNMLPLRQELVGNPTFRELLADVRRRTLGALAHQDLPLDRLVAELRPDRQGDGSPLFRVAFGIQERTEVETGGGSPPASLRMVPVDTGVQRVRFDLTLWLHADADGLLAAWTYSSDLFDPESVDRFHAGWSNLLALVADDPDRRLDRLDLITEDERRRRREAGRSWEREQGAAMLGKRRRRAVAAVAGKDDGENDDDGSVGSATATGGNNR